MSVDNKALYEFIKRWYKPSRFEDRNKYWPTYSQGIVDGYAKELAQHGKAFITKHESVTNFEIIFNDQLEITNFDDPIKESRINRGNLSHIF